MIVGYGLCAEQAGLLECAKAAAFRALLAGPKNFGTAFCGGAFVFRFAANGRNKFQQGSQWSSQRQRFHIFEQAPVFGAKTATDTILEN